MDEIKGSLEVSFLGLQRSFVGVYRFQGGDSLKP